MIRVYVIKLKLSGECVPEIHCQLQSGVISCEYLIIEFRKKHVKAKILKSMNQISFKNDLKPPYPLMGINIFTNYNVLS